MEVAEDAGCPACQVPAVWEGGKLVLEPCGHLLCGECVSALGLAGVSACPVCTTEFTGHTQVGGGAGGPAAPEASEEEFARLARELGVLRVRACSARATVSQARVAAAEFVATELERGMAELEHLKTQVAQVVEHHLLAAVRRRVGDLWATRDKALANQEAELAATTEQLAAAQRLCRPGPAGRDPDALLLATRVRNGLKTSAEFEGLAAPTTFVLASASTAGKVLEALTQACVAEAAEAAVAAYVPDAASTEVSGPGLASFQWGLPAEHAAVTHCVRVRARERTGAVLPLTEDQVAVVASHDDGGSGRAYVRTGRGGLLDVWYDSPPFAARSMAVSLYLMGAGVLGGRVLLAHWEPVGRTTCAWAAAPDVETELKRVLRRNGTARGKAAGWSGYDSQVVLDSLQAAATRPSHAHLFPAAVDAAHLRLSAGTGGRPPVWFLEGLSRAAAAAVVAAAEGLDVQAWRLAALVPAEVHVQAGTRSVFCRRAAAGGGGTFRALVLGDLGCGG